MLSYIESVIGYNFFEDFLTYYVSNNFLTSIDQYTVRTTFSSFLEIMYNGMPDTVNQVLAQIDWEAWIFNAGLDPTNSLDFNNPYAQ
jgi:hypothetical protein